MSLPKKGTEIIHAEDNRMGQAEKAAAAADVAIVGEVSDLED